MRDLRDAARQALEALDLCRDWPGAYDECSQAITALRAALEQPEQEPEAFMYVGIKHDGTTHGPHLIWEPEYMDAMSAEKGAKTVPLYTHPPRREWRGLSKDESLKLWGMRSDGPSNLEIIGFFRAIEAALKERNA